MMANSEDGRRFVGALALTLGLLTGVQSAQAAQPDAKLLAAVRACDKSSRVLLEKLVSIESGSGDAEGLNAVGTVEAAELSALGAQVKAIAPPPGTSPGNNVLATLTGTGKGRILLISHMDTVFSRGDVAGSSPIGRATAITDPAPVTTSQAESPRSAP
jgi:glutamate carboxypeptidase